MSTSVLAVLDAVQSHALQGAHAQIVELHQHISAILPAAGKTPKPKPTPPGGGVGVSNPFTGLFPDFKVLGVKFDGLWKKVFGATWALSIIYAGWKFIPALISYMNHKGGNHPQQQSEALSEVKHVAAGGGGLICLTTVLAVGFAILT